MLEVTGEAIERKRWSVLIDVGAVKSLKVLAAEAKTTMGGYLETLLEDKYCELLQDEDKARRARE